MEDKNIIRIKNTADGLARYEELLFRRDALRRDAEQFQISYISEFGELIVESFRARIECIRKKKIIAYCQRQVNLGRPISGAGLDSYIEREMTDYQDKLETMIRDTRAARESKGMPEYQVFRIKRLYRGLAKLIHPDLHPELAGDRQISGFWNEIVIAYEHNQFDALEELDFKVKKYLEDTGMGEPAEEILIFDLPGRIAGLEKEIEKIMTTDPYLYRLILEDEDSMEAKRNELREEIKDFQNYSAELDEMIAKFDIKRMYS